MALRGTLERLGFDPELLVWSVILVAPRNFGRTPVAHRIPLTKKSMSLARVLNAVPETASVLGTLPEDLTFDVDPGEEMTDDAARLALASAVGMVDALYQPECIQNCDMARFCRTEAWASDDPARLGREARENLAGVHSLADALRLARSGPEADEDELSDVAEALEIAYSALARARSRVPTADVAPRYMERGDS